MLQDFYEYDHPALYLHLVEQKAAPRAWRFIYHSAKERKRSKRAGNKRVRRSVKQYLQTGSKPRLKKRVVGDSYDIA